MVKRGLKQRHYVAFLTAMDSELENYIGGQLKINLEPRRRRDQHAFTYRGVIEDVEVDGNQVQVSLEWVAKTNVGKYTLDTNFDLDLSFAIERMTEDGVGNLRIITEQGEEMTFFQKGRHDNIQPENVIGFRFAVPRREQRGLLQPFKGKPMVTKIRVDYVDGSYDKFSTLTGGKETVGCYCWDGFHFQPFTLDKAIPAEDVAQFLLNVSTNGKFVPTPDASSVTSRENFTSEEGLTGPEIDAVVRGGQSFRL